MSSFTDHKKNIAELKQLGFDISNALDEKGCVTSESWGYDELTYLVGDIVSAIKAGQLLPEGKQLVSEDAIGHLYDKHPEVYKEFYERV